MPYYRSVGDVPRKRHTIARRGGNVLHEELWAGGLLRDSSLLYHRHSPSAIVAAEAVLDPTQATFSPNVPLLPHHLRTTEVVEEARGRLARQRRRRGDDRLGRGPTTEPLYRNAVGDELVYVQSGPAVLRVVFGRLDVGPGDYVVVPTSTTHRWIVRRRPLGAL